MNFSIKSKKEYLRVIESLFNNNKDDFKGLKVGIFGTLCSARVIADFFSDYDCYLLATNPIESEAYSLKIIDISTVFLHQIDCVILSSLSNQDGQYKALISLGYKGKIFTVPEMPHLSTIMYDDFLDYTKLREFRNVHSQTPCFIVGNAPSVMSVDISKLPCDSITMFCNGFFKVFQGEPTYYFALDKFSIKSWCEDIRKLSSTFIFPSHLAEFCIEKDLYTKSLFFPSCYKKSAACYDISNIFCDGVETQHTVVCAMLQIAGFMGVNPIYIVGVDLNYHVKDCYPSKDYHPVGTPKYDYDAAIKYNSEMLLGISRAVESLKRMNISVYCCSKESLLVSSGTISYIPFERAVSISDE